MSYANYFNDRIGGVTSTKAFYDATAKEPEQKKGGSAQDTAFLLKQIVLNEMDQRNMLKLRFAGRKTSTKSADTDLIAENDAV